MLIIVKPDLLWLTIIREMIIISLQLKIPSSTITVLNAAYEANGGRPCLGKPGIPGFHLLSIYADVDLADDSYLKVGERLNSISLDASVGSISDIDGLMDRRAIEIGEQGEIAMKIAVPSRDDLGDEHFSQCEEFLSVQVEGKAVVSETTIASNESCGCNSDVAGNIGEGMGCAGHGEDYACSHYY